MAASTEKRTLLIVFLTVFLDLVGFGIIIPIQPFLAETLGARPSIVTLLGASYSLMTFLCAPLWGRLSDRIGRRPVMLASIAMSVAGYALFGWAASLPLLFAARLLAGIGSGNLGTAQAVIADSTSGDSRAKGMGIIGAAFGLGFICGPAIGGVLSQWGLAAPAYAAAALAAVNWIFAFTMLPETYPAAARAEGAKRPAHGRSPLSLPAIRHAARHANVEQLFTIFLLCTVGFSMMEMVLGLFIEHTWLVRDEGMGHAKRAAALTSYILIVVGVTATIVQGGLIGRLAARFGERRLIIAGTFLVSAGLIGIPIAGRIGSYALMFPVSILLAAGSGIYSPSLMSLLSRSVDKNEQGTVLGLGQSFSALGRVIGPSIAGVVFQLNASMPFYLGAGLVLFCTAIAMTLRTEGLASQRVATA